MKNANIKKAQEIAQRFVSKQTKDLPVNKILTHQIETACIEMANWKDELIEKLHHHAHNMYTEMMNLSTDTSGIRKAMEDYKHFLFAEYYTDDE
jgi:recombinational DNA repair ATPase RecF